MTPAAFAPIAPTLPAQPGIYKYFDDQGNLLYVGKAKHLRKRVSSYFVKQNASYKTHELVRRIASIEFTITHTEHDAFLLENSLIKQFQPPFNISLKDDKTYPYIVIKKEPFPRIFFTRRKLKDGSEYLGPFTSVGKVRELLEMVKQNIPLRTCKLPLTESNIRKGKFKVCLEYHLGNCKGPCEGLQSAEDYTDGLLQVRNILKGNLGPVIKHLENEMMTLSANLAFEKAAQIKSRIQHLEQYQARSVIVSKQLGNLDVFAILKDGPHAYVSYLQVRDGVITDSQTLEYESHLDETAEEVLSFAIGNIRSIIGEPAAKEILVALPIDYVENETVITLPKAGDKKRLLDMAQKNVDYFLAEIKKRKTLHLETSSEQRIQQVLADLQTDLHLPTYPQHIECFDNSNFQGSYPVSAMVCFKDGIPSKKDYRHFNVKTVEGINDFATMKEAVYRRYKRLKEESAPFPQLVIIDGGKGQLGAAMEAIAELKLIGKFTVVGLAKNEEELFFPGDSESVKLGYESEPLRLIRRIRDEVHRFGITFHRNKRSKGTFKTDLTSIEGIGPKTATLLLKTFKSVKQVELASITALGAVVGPQKAKQIKDYFTGQK